MRAPARSSRHSPGCSALLQAAITGKLAKRFREASEVGFREMRPTIRFSTRRLTNSAQSSPTMMRSPRYALEGLGQTPPLITPECRLLQTGQCTDRALFLGKPG